MCGPIVLSNWPTALIAQLVLSYGAVLVYPTWNQPRLIRSGCKSWPSCGWWTTLLRWESEKCEKCFLPGEQALKWESGQSELGSCWRAHSNELRQAGWNRDLWFMEGKVLKSPTHPPSQPQASDPDNHLKSWDRRHPNKYDDSVTWLYCWGLNASDRGNETN